MYDVDAVRRDFPILERRVHCLPLTYLDSAATTQKPRAVIDALTSFYECSNANVHRGVHTLGEEATEAFEGTRAHLARFLGAGRPEEIVFTRGTTEAINLVASAWGRQNINPDDEIVLTELEHHSNIVPWQLLAAATGARLRWIPVLDDGSLDMDAAQEAIGSRTRLVAVTQMSNVLGTITPLADIIDLAHAHGSLVLVDGAQSVSHLPVDVRALGCDFFAMSAHKLLGPTGVGALYGRWEILSSMEPYQGGGSMIDTVTYERSTWADPPARFEAGTPDIAGVAAFDAALTYLDELGMEVVQQHDRELTDYAIDRLRRVDGVTVFGTMPLDQRAGAISIAVKDIHPHDLGTFLDQQGIAIRAGHHCAQPLMRRLDVVATARASFSVYTTNGEVDRLVQAIGDAQRYFEVIPSGSPAAG
jgi:cysteine desulfurase / selenocysteine lyase